MPIVCTGSVAYDYLMSFPGFFREHILPEHLEKISLSFLVDTMIKQRGGVAPNIAYTLALLGDRPMVMATVGEDFADYRIWMDEHGIDTHLIKEIEGKFTASFFVNTDLSNAQIASFYTGAMANASELSLAEFEHRHPDLVIISPNDPGAMDKYVIECQKMGLRYLYDPSQQVVRNTPEQLRRGVKGAYSLFVNEYEYELLQKHTGMSASDIQKRVSLVVVTLGEKGSRIISEGREILVPVFKPEAILDPTGVGDAFRGGFLRGWNLGLDLRICGEMGALAATYCLEQRGTQAHHYTSDEFIRRYRTVFNDQGALDVLRESIRIGGING